MGDADPFLLYGHGLGYGYGIGHYGLGYYGKGLLMLMLIPTTMVDTLDMVWVTMVATVLATMAMDMVWDTVDTTGDKSSHQQGYLDIHRDLSVNHQLLCQQKNGLFQFESHPPPVLPVSVLPA